MRESYNQIVQTMKDKTVWLFGSVWGAVQNYWASGAWWSSAYFWVTVFWFITWLMGTGRSIYFTVRGDPPEERFQPAKSTRSVVRLIIWLLALGVATGLQASKVPAGWLPAGVINSVVLFTQGAYMLRGLGRLATLSGNEDQGRVLSLVADKTDEYMGQQVRTHTTVTVTETKVIEPAPPANPPSQPPLA